MKFLLVSAFLALVLPFDVALAIPRVKVRDPNLGYVIPCRTHSQERGFFAFLPHCKGIGKRGTRSYSVSYNSLGVRGPDYPPKAPKGVFRVLLLGHSQFAGPGLDLKDTMPVSLERELKRRHLKLEIVSGCVEGYFAVRQSVMLKQYLKAYSPDMVILTIASSSLFGDYLNYPWLQYDSSGIPMRLNRVPLLWQPNFPAFPREFLQRDTTGKRWGMYISWFRLWPRVPATFQLKPLFGKNSDDDVVGRLMAPQVALTKYMNRATTEAGAKFLILYNTDEEITNDLNEGDIHMGLAKAVHFFERDIEISGAKAPRFLIEAGLPVKTYGYPLELMNDPSYRVEGDYHFNEKGTKRYSEILATLLENEIREAIKKKESSRHQPLVHAKKQG